MNTSLTLVGIALTVSLLLSAEENVRMKDSASKTGGADAVKPLFKNSIVSTEFDFITADDPSVFKSLRFIGRETREMPDKRNDELIVKDVFVFETSFSDGSLVKIWAHSSFGNMKKAEGYALMMSGPLGRLPAVMRRKLSHVIIHKGNEVAFGESEGHFFVLYSENMETRLHNHDLEETVFHESVHATLESGYSKSKVWLSAQEADRGFITEYAADKPMLEDLPESALFAYTMMKCPGRLPQEVEKWIQKNMPQRLAFFRDVFSEAELEKNKVKSESSR